MKEYYQQLKKIQDFHSLNRLELLDYIWRQKADLSLFFKIDPNFWVLLDYMIYLTKEISAKSDLDPEGLKLFQKQNNALKQIISKIPDSEFYYLKKDLNNFYALLSCLLNLNEKRLSHFIPYNLFKQSIENMTVLYPLLDKCCDVGILVKKDYVSLIFRYAVGGFAPKLLKIVDYLIWLSAAWQILLPKDKELFARKILSLCDKFVSEDDLCGKSPNSPKVLAVELHDLLATANIKNGIRELLPKITAKADAGDFLECVQKLASIFIDVADVSPAKYILRDLYIATQLSSNLIKRLTAEENRLAREDLLLAEALKPYFLQVSRYALDVKKGIEICRLFEITDYLQETLPSFVMRDEIIKQLGEIKKILEEELDSVSAANDISVDVESADLFKAKAKQIFAAQF